MISQEKRFARIAKNGEMNGSNDVNNKHDVGAGVDVANKNVIFFVTHFNVFLYATCFFIQVGTMPVKYFITLY
jgi:hypothetical protein